MDWKKIFYPGLAALFTAFLFWVLGWLETAPTIIIPKDAVVAFELSKCPDGWDEYHEAAGRTIIGVGGGDKLTNRTLMEKGGRESHTLLVDEMPLHSHSYTFPNTVIENGEGGGGVASRTYARDEKSGDAGGSSPHNNMPPFISLRYCKKN